MPVADTELLFIRQAEIEEKKGLSYFDSLIAASALAVDGAIIVSDDSAFDRWGAGVEKNPNGIRFHTVTPTSFNIAYIGAEANYF